MQSHTRANVTHIDPVINSRGLPQHVLTLQKSRNFITFVYGIIPADRGVQSRHYLYLYLYLLNQLNYLSLYLYSDRILEVGGVYTGSHIKSERCCTF